MVAIQGIGGIPEPKPGAAKVRDTKDSQSSKTAQSQDGVVISNEAQAAAKITTLIQVAASQPDVRADRVEAARASLERGDYKNPEIVAKVAQKISKYLP